jgi:hypothetical protein
VEAACARPNQKAVNLVGVLNNWGPGSKRICPEHGIFLYCSYLLVSIR